MPAHRGQFLGHDPLHGPISCRRSARHRDTTRPARRRRSCPYVPLPTSQWNSLSGDQVAGWHRNRYRSGPSNTATTRSAVQGGDFQMATSGSLHMANSGYFFMATDSPLAESGHSAHKVDSCNPASTVVQPRQGIGSGVDLGLPSLRNKATGSPSLPPAVCAETTWSTSALPARRPVRGCPQVDAVRLPRLPVRTVGCNEPASLQHEVQHSRRQTSRPKHAQPALGKSPT